MQVEISVVLLIDNAPGLANRALVEIQAVCHLGVAQSQGPIRVPGLGTFLIIMRAKQTIDELPRFIQWIAAKEAERLCPCGITGGQAIERFALGQLDLAARLGQSTTRLPE